MRWPVVLALLLVALVRPASAGPATAPPDPFEAFGLVRFDSAIRAPEFALRDVSGNLVSVSPRSGSADVLVFWATW
ncbi:MAG: hypothetical protein ACREM3_20290 [Candidatus Rokuibacteriota bacterium]